MATSREPLTSGDNNNGVINVIKQNIRCGSEGNQENDFSKGRYLSFQVAKIALSLAIFGSTYIYYEEPPNNKSPLTNLTSISLAFTHWTNLVMFIQSVYSLLTVCASRSFKPLDNLSRQMQAALLPEATCLAAMMFVGKYLGVKSTKTVMSTKLEVFQHLPSLVISLLEAKNVKKPVSDVFQQPGAAFCTLRLIYTAVYLLSDGIYEEPGYSNVDFNQDGKINRYELSMMVVSFLGFSSLGSAMAYGAWKSAEFTTSKAVELICPNRRIPTLFSAEPNPRPESDIYNDNTQSIDGATLGP